MIILDCSGSTYRNKALSKAKGAIVQIMESAYLQRARTSLIQLSGQGIEITIPAKRAMIKPYSKIEQIKGGGGTPLLQGLKTALATMKKESRRFPDEAQHLIIFTDGRSKEQFNTLTTPADICIVDMESGPSPLGRCKQIARTLNAKLLALDELPIV